MKGSENANTHYGRIRIVDGRIVRKLVPFRNLRVSFARTSEMRIPAKS